MTESSPNLSHEMSLWKFVSNVLNNITNANRRGKDSYLHYLWVSETCIELEADLS